MARLKVTLAAIDAPEVPAWVAPQLAEKNIDLVIHECTTQDELLKYAGDADIVWLFGGSRILTPERLGLLPMCKAIICMGSGTDNIPVEDATRLASLSPTRPKPLPTRSRSTPLGYGWRWYGRSPGKIARFGAAYGIVTMLGRTGT